MYPVIPTELMGSAVQLAIYFVTVMGTVLGFLMCGRA